jgi:hypothetical protein
MKKEITLGRKPDYRLRLKDDKTGRWVDVGAAWKNENGSISVRLNMCVVLNERLGVEPVLFPVEPEKKTDDEQQDKETETLYIRSIKSQDV